MIFIKFSFVTRERDRWCVLKRKKKRKKERSILECLFQKRVIYTRVNWEWNIRSDTGHLIPLLSLTYIALYIPIGGNHIFSTFVIPHTTLGQSNFIRTLVTPFFSPYQDKQSLHKFHHFPCTYKLGQLQSPFPFMKSHLHYLYCLLNQVVYTSKFKANIANPTHQNWGSPIGRFASQSLSNISNSLNTYPFTNGLLNSVFKRKVDGYTILISSEFNDYQ